MIRVSTPQRAQVYALKRNIGQALSEGAMSANAKMKLRLAAKLAPHLFGQYADLR